MHSILLSISDLDQIISLTEPSSQHFDFFAIIGANALNFKFDRLLEVFLVFLNLPCLVVLLPGLEYLSGPLFLVLDEAVGDHFL